MAFTNQFSSVGQPSLESIPRLGLKAGLFKVGGRWFASSPDGLLHRFVEEGGSASEVAELIVALVDGRRSVAQLVDAVEREFEVSRTLAEAHVLEFIGLLANKHVLTF